MCAHMRTFLLIFSFKRPFNNFKGVKKAFKQRTFKRYMTTFFAVYDYFFCGNMTTFFAVLKKLNESDFFLLER